MFDVGDRAKLRVDSSCGLTPGTFGKKGQCGTVLTIHLASEKKACYFRFDDVVCDQHEWYVYIDELEPEFIELKYDPTQQGDTEEDI